MAIVDIKYSEEDFDGTINWKNRPRRNIIASR
jgi:hypothetical protein